MNRLFQIVIVLFLGFAPLAAEAGSGAASEPVLPTEDIASFSNRVQQDLAARGARVAIVARVGRDPATLPNGIHYTHVAYWVYSTLTLADGSTATGYRVYNLYQTAGDLGRSELVQDSPEEFFAAVYRLDAGIIIPDPRLQQRILDVIASPTYAALHNEAYTVFANPASRRFQNCTEHTLDVLVASLYQTDDIDRIKTNIARYFEPQSIEVSDVKRALASIASSALRSSDHEGEIKTATFGSIKRFMNAYGLSTETYRLTEGEGAPL